MDQAFIRSVCLVCPHLMAVGNGQRGGLKMQRCFFARDQEDPLRVSFQKGFKHGQELAEIGECPDKPRAAKFLAAAVK